MSEERRIEDIRTGSEAAGDVLALDGSLNPAWQTPAKAAFVDPATATAGQVAQALIDAGLMASS